MSSKPSISASSSKSSHDFEPIPINAQVAINAELIQGLVVSGILDRATFRTAFEPSNNANADAAASGNESSGIAGDIVSSSGTGNSADNVIDLTQSDSESDAESVCDVSVISILSSDESVQSVTSVKSDESVKSVKSVTSVKSDESVKSVKSVTSVKSDESVKSVKSVKSVTSVKSDESVKSVKSAKSVASVEFVKVVRKQSSSSFSPIAPVSASSASSASSELSVSSLLPARDLRKEFEPPASQHKRRRKGAKGSVWRTTRDHRINCLKPAIDDEPNWEKSPSSIFSFPAKYAHKLSQLQWCPHSREAPGGFRFDLVLVEENQPLCLEWYCLCITIRQYIEGGFHDEGDTAAIRPFHHTRCKSMFGALHVLMRTSHVIDRPKGATDPYYDYGLSHFPPYCGNCDFRRGKNSSYLDEFFLTGSIGNFHVRFGTF